ncbi:hypothetical protein RQP46_008767 [Phenoliferia psychrophenolica]
MTHLADAPAPLSPAPAPAAAAAATALPPPALPVQRKSFLGKAATLPKMIPRPSLRFRARRSTLFAPEDPSAPPLGTLVIRVLAAKDLVARDRNGTSDPFVVIRFADARSTGPTIKECLNPVWGTAGEATESKLEVKVWDSRGLGRERIEIVIWDKDRVGKQFLGEVSLGIMDWWGDSKNWKDGLPPVGIDDPANQPVWHAIRSSRRTSVTISGQLLVQVGFAPVPPTPSTNTTATLVSASTSLSLLPAQRTRILEVLQRILDEREGNRRTSKEDLVLLASPTEGVGTKPIDDTSPLSATIPHLAPDESSSEDSDSEAGGSSSGESDEEFESVAEAEAETSTDDSDVETLAAPPQSQSQTQPSYFDEPHANSPSPLPSSSLSPSPSPSLPIPSPSLLAPSPAPTPRRGLSLPGFMKRTGSSKSVSTTSSLKLAAEAATSTSTSGDTSDQATTSADNEVGLQKKKRFSRKKKVQQVQQEGEVGGGGEGETKVKGKGRRKKSQKKSKREGGSGGGATGLGRRGTKRDYRYETDEDMFGLVQIEVKGANDLPRFKNMLKTGWDMDPFVVVSFGKRVFRTRVIRHSLNPVWDEKLFFSVRRTEANWIVAFNLYDWDKMRVQSSNDHVGDVSVPLAELIGGTALQPDERGLYPATSDGRLIGDDFYDHELKVLVDDKDAAAASDAQPTTLKIRAKFTPYDALRQQFLRIYLRQYDIDESGSYSHLEIFSMLDSLGSTLSKETISSFFTRFGKTDSQELTTDEVVICLEQELRRPQAEKRLLEDTAPDSVPESGNLTPSPGQSLAFEGPVGEETDQQQQTDPSSAMNVLEPEAEVVTNQELGTVVKQPSPKTQQSQSSSGGTSLDPSEDSATPDTVERVINIKECPLCHKPRMTSRAELDIITHMGICSSTDPRSINRIVVGEYVTASQAQRKWFTKVISKATKGAYQLGANSANIIVQDRQTGMLQEEKMAVYVRLGIRLMYKGMGSGGGMEGSRIRRMLESMSIKQGVKYNSPNSVREIQPFIAFHNLNMDEALEPISSFKTFNEFFYRKLKPGAREIDMDPNVVVSPADCRAMFFPTIDDATKIWIKGRDFSLSKLLGEGFKDKAADYEGGSLAIFRLAPQDYHRYHSPVDGVCGPHKKIAGQYYTVNPMAIRSSIDIYGDNVRLVAPITSPVFGETMHIWVGAMMVGSICMTMNEGDTVKRGDEAGYFAFGGSTILLLFKPKTVVFDPDLVLNSSNSVETLVRMGSRIGCKA